MPRYFLILLYGLDDSGARFFFGVGVFKNKADLAIQLIYLELKLRSGGNGCSGMIRHAWQNIFLISYEIGWSAEYSFELNLVLSLRWTEVPSGSICQRS